MNLDTLGIKQPVSPTDLTVFVGLLGVLVWMVANLTVAPYVF